MIRHDAHTDDAIRSKIRNGEIAWGGNRKCHIYGRLDCKSGRRMKRTNRVFFQTEAEALAAGYRPCGHCMRAAYLKWKEGHMSTP